MKKIQFIISIVILAICFASCETVHEFPEDDPNRNVDLHLSFSFNDDTLHLANYKEIEYSKYKNASEKVTFAVRYTIELYDGDKMIDRKVVIDNNVIDNKVVVPFTVPINKKYTALAWIDQVPPHNTADIYFDTSSLKYVGLISDNYLIGAAENDAFAGSLSFDLSTADINQNKVIAKQVPLNRPLAKFKIISTDLKKYYETATKKPAKVIFNYTQKLPSFYMTQDKMVTNYIDDFTVSSDITDFTDEECILFFDWIFANEEEQIIKISFEVFDEDNKLIIKSPIIDVPLVRNKETIVKDKFFTTNYNDGIGIDDKFEGEIVIEL